MTNKFSSKEKFLEIHDSVKKNIKISPDQHESKLNKTKNKYITPKPKLMLNKNEQKHNKIYHINGNKLDNRIDNLVELSQLEHKELNFQLEKLVFDLVKKNILLFDLHNKRYVLSDVINNQNLERSLGFEDVAIKQKKNICNSRLDVNIESEILKGIKRPTPLIASNMSTVVDANFCIKLYELGALGILHRADSHDNIINSVKLIASKCDLVAASIGVEKDQFDFAKRLINNGCNIITIDIAHGYSDIVLDLGKKIKKFSPSTKLIIGNTTNIDLIYECYNFVDAVKVGIANGMACETKNTAGCNEKQFSSVLKFKTIARNFEIPIISDGGIREPADLTKAIAAGANSAMIGSIFAACPESAAETVLINGEKKKLYAGMASEYVQNKWKGGLKPGTCAEGGVRFLDVGPSVNNIIETYSGALRSGITYAGANDILSFQKEVEFVRIK